MSQNENLSQALNRSALPVLPNLSEDKKSSYATKPPMLRRVILLDKMTRWEVLCREAQGDTATLKDMELEFPGMVETHRTHTAAIEHIIHELRDVHHISVDVIKAQSSQCVDLDGVDAIVSAGGDGTFLEAASLLDYTPPYCLSPSDADRAYSKRDVLYEDAAKSRGAGEKSRKERGATETCGGDDSDGTSSQQQIWVFGLNTDPSRSEGRLLMATGAPPPITILCLEDQQRSVKNDGPEGSKLPPSCDNRQMFPETQPRNEAHKPEEFCFPHCETVSSCQLDAPRCLKRSVTIRLSDPATHKRQLSEIILRLVKGNVFPIQRRRLRVSILDPLAARGRTLHERPPGVIVRSSSINRSRLRLGTDLSTLSETQKETMFNASPKSNSPGTKGDATVRGRLRSASCAQQSPRCFGAMDGCSAEVRLKIPEDYDATTSSPRAPATPESPRTKLFGCSLVHRDFCPKRSALKYRAVNDVLLTRSESHLTMYVEISVDGGPPYRSKNSGVVVCTGSGSSAWALNISKVPESTVRHILDDVLNSIPASTRSTFDPPSAQQLCAKINASFVFDPQEPRMRYVIREPIDNRIFATPHPSGFCKQITLTPLTPNACLSLDGLSLVPLRLLDIHGSTYQEAVSQESVRMTRYYNICFDKKFVVYDEEWSGIGRVSL